MAKAKDYTLFTIGYEGKEVSDFIYKLKSAGVEYLIDVREQPISRKKGFSKNVLAELLEKENIKYVHVKELGSPKEIRDQLKQDHNEEVFFKKFSEYMDTQRSVIERAYSYLMEGVCCLMCMERLHINCHRSVVADKIKEYDGNGLLIKHI
ncbi:MAG: DUF488 domain-containing protein [Nitrospirae bacterium]|nr:DUF488 domain-containing protein [Nitrospirota bacterium]